MSADVRGDRADFRGDSAGSGEVRGETFVVSGRDFGIGIRIIIAGGFDTGSALTGGSVTVPGSTTDSGVVRGAR